MSSDMSEDDKAAEELLATMLAEEEAPVVEEPEACGDDAVMVHCWPEAWRAALLATLPDEQFLSGGLYLEEQEIKWDYSGVTRAL